ncbi:MAG: segregation/condensation protein A [Deltaproteobacteria bacterium]|nr:segregation/condensation protein A [Deltaproteobacteria bacterium]
MDLLVHLIKKHEVDIYNIPIALITKRYLEYLEWMKSMNIDVAGDFIVLASTLTQIKSKMLLPVHEEENIDEDPRMDIIKPLEEYLQIKSAAELLANRNLLGEDIFTRNPGQENHLISPDDEMVKVGLFELIDAFQRILERVSPHTRMDITADTISVKDKISQLVDVFEARGSITFDELFSESVDRSEVIVTFLAILEMVKLYLVRIAQHAQSGVIRLFYI